MTTILTAALANLEQAGKEFDQASYRSAEALDFLISALDAGGDTVRNNAILRARQTQQRRYDAFCALSRAIQEVNEAGRNEIKGAECNG